MYAQLLDVNRLSLWGIELSQSTFKVVRASPWRGWNQRVNFEILTFIQIVYFSIFLQFDYEVIDPDVCKNGTSSRNLLVDEETCIQISSSLVECEEFVYETAKIQTTIATENNLVCKNHWISKIITFTTMVGMVIGPTFSGMISDKIGRIMTIGKAEIFFIFLHYFYFNLKKYMVLMSLFLA